MRSKWMYLISLVTALACSDGKTEPEDTSSTDVEDTDTTDTEDTEAPDTGVETPDYFWTEGPALPDCEAQEGTDGLLALSGVVFRWSNCWCCTMGPNFWAD